MTREWWELHQSGIGIGIGNLRKLSQELETRTASGMGSPLPLHVGQSVWTKVHLQSLLCTNMIHYIPLSLISGFRGHI